MESSFVTQIVTESTQIVTESTQIVMESTQTVTESTTSLAESTTSLVESTSLTDELFESKTRIIQLETSSLPNSMVCVCYSIKVLMTCLIIRFIWLLLMTDNKH